jgi:hypothetical protein
MLIFSIILIDIPKTPAKLDVELTARYAEFSCYSISVSPRSLMSTATCCVVCTEVEQSYQYQEYYRFK